MRSRIWISSLAAAGLLVVGSVAPAFAAPSASAADGSSVTAEEHGVGDHAASPGMASMHKQMMKGKTDMTGMTGMAGMAGMKGESDPAKMGARMKAHHADATTTTAHTHSSKDK